MKTERYTTVRTNREYEIEFNVVNRYSDTYPMCTTIEDYELLIAEKLNVDLDKIEEGIPDQLHYDIQEIAAYCLLYLTQHNRCPITVSLVV